MLPYLFFYTGSCYSIYSKENAGKNTDVDLLQQIQIQTLHGKPKI